MNRRSQLTPVFILLCVFAGLAWLNIRQRGAARPVDPAAVLVPGSAAGFNVVLITLDTTRVDHLPCYGYKGLETPAIDAIASRGVRFDHAVTTVPLTLPAHSSILTGLNPFSHGVRNNGAYHLPESRITLAEMFKEKGYQTSAFLAAFVLDAQFGLNQGFDVYNFEISDDGRRDPLHLAHERSADYVTNAALHWLKGDRTSSDKPFFMWVHYYDPHAPYEAPLKDLPEFSDLDHFQAYDAEIAFVDLHLGRLLDALDNGNLRDRTLIVLTTDHGESLGEHGLLHHGSFIYDSCMRAGLIFSAPSLFDRAYRVSDRVVGIVDIAPTLASLVGFDLPEPVDGIDLATAEHDPDRAIYIETLNTLETLGCAPLYGLRRLHDKFILAPRPEYYDLRKDPGELENLYTSQPPEARDLEQRLRKIMSAWPDGPSDAAREMTPEDLARLEALGYLGHTGGAIDEQRDPKDYVPLLEDLSKARALLKENKCEEALVAAREVVDQVPGVSGAVFVLCDVYNCLNQGEEAVRALEKVITQLPVPTVEVHIRLASELMRLNRFDEMEVQLDAAERIDKRCGPVHVIRGDRFLKEKRYDDAIASYRKAMEIDGARLGPRVQDKIREAGVLRDAGG